jgi:TolA-binding protein
MPFWTERPRDDLLRVVQRLESRVSGMERHIYTLERMLSNLQQRSTAVTDQLDALRAGEQNLQQAISDAAARVQASLDALAAKIAAGVDHTELAADVAAITADVQAVAAIGGPATPTPAPTPSPTPPPAPEPTTTTATAGPGQSTLDGQPLPATEQGAGPTG